MVRRLSFLLIFAMMAASGWSQVTRIDFAWPDHASLAPGQEFTVRASVVNADEAVYGYAFDIVYDSTSLEVTAASSVSGGFSLSPTVSPALTSDPRNPGVTADRGYSAIDLFGTQTKLDQDLADITFRVLDSPANSQVTLTPRKRISPDFGEQPAITYNLTEDDEAIVAGEKTYDISVPVTLATALVYGDPSYNNSPFTVAIDMSQAPEDLAEAHIKVSATENSVEFLGVRSAEWAPDQAPSFEPDLGSAPFNAGGFDYRYVHAADLPGSTTFSMGRAMYLDFRTSATMSQTFSIELGAYDNTPPNSTLVGQSLNVFDVAFDNSATQNILVEHSAIARNEAAMFLIGIMPGDAESYDLNTDGTADAGDVITAPPTQ
ncbi:hypothetical protein KQI84_01185 [bacterium]|nr:hypothetical protein [bacterium]